MKEMVGGCCVCSDDRGWPENPLVYCDGQSCTVAVHQACYGIVTVPTGPWYCRKCESQERSVKVKCELCPSKYGALKRTDNSGWAHVVCALYIPEVRFGNVTTMEPIQLQLIPAERFNKVCYICEKNGKASSSTVGACMQCNKPGCKQQFHVTCAQGLGLLCEEAGNYFDNVKYCGYCQHHYSKLKKGGNVKTIPPYKPVSSETHLSDSNSEKEADSATINKTSSTTQSSSSSGKRSSSSNNKISSSSSKTNSNNSKSTTSTHQKSSVHNSSSKSIEKPKSSSSATIKSAKNTEDTTATIITNTASENSDLKTDKVNNKEEADIVVVEKTDLIKENKITNKKRKANSRTPTPITIVPTDNISVVISGAANLTSEINSLTQGTVLVSDKKETNTTSDNLEKPKKAKTDQASQQQITALISATASTTKPITPPRRTETDTATSTPTIQTHSIIQTAPGGQQMNSLVVSVPLHNTSLSPTNQIIANNPTSVSSIPYSHLPAETADNMQTESSNGSNITATNSEITNILSSEVGELKITYEKQPGSSSANMELERITPTSDMPSKRSRSQSTEKVERSGRTKKRGSNGVGQYNNNHTKRASRSQLATPSPQSSQPPIKESPPSSPSSESLGAPPSSSSRKNKGRKSAPASVSSSSSSTKDSKENIKLFQNGLCAPHMMGNQLNPNSNMAQKMTDHLNSELEAHSIFNPNENSGNLVGPQLHHRVIAQTRSNSTGGSSTASGASGFSSMLGGSGGSIPQTLDQLLERQWEQGSQFLMEQAQHFDIASLLSCLHQLRAENMRLEEHVSSLLQRRDHLLAVNARLAIPLTGPPATPQSNHPHTVNNIHPAVAANHAEVPRSRHSASYTSHAGPHNPPIENGLPTESSQTYTSHAHRSPAANPPQRSPTVRHPPASGNYPNGGLIRQNADTGGRSAPRSQPYAMYQNQGPSSGQQQMVIRREPDIHHQQASKPS